MEQVGFTDDSSGCVTGIEGGRLGDGEMVTRGTRVQAGVWARTSGLRHSSTSSVLRVGEIQHEARSHGSVVGGPVVPCPKLRLGGR